MISPKSANNTFELSYFADLRFSCWSSKGALLSPTVFLWQKLLRNMKQMILCSLSKEFVFSCRKMKEQIAETRNLLDIKLIHEAGLYKQQHELLKTERNSLKRSKYLVKLQTSWLELYRFFLLTVSMNFRVTSLTVGPRLNRLKYSSWTWNLIDLNITWLNLLCHLFFKNTSK